MTIRFIHAADLHLDRPFKGMSQLPETLFRRISEAPFRALHKIVNDAIEMKVDFIVISGDVFDGGNPSLRARQRFLKEVLRLAPFEIPLYLIHGNHDPLESQPMDLSAEGLFIFSEQVECKRFEKEGKPSVHLYGFSYPTRHVTEPMTAFYQKKGGADYHVGLLHGYLIGNGDHDAYAPFSVQELAEKEFDYWALGHIHQRQQLAKHLPIYYPGTPQGLSIKETGDKGVHLVTLNKKDCQVTFLSTAEVLFETLTLHIDDISTIDALVQSVDEQKKAWREKGKAGFLRLNLVGQSALYSELQEPSLHKELLEVFQDGEDDEPCFCWISDIISEALPFYPRDVWLKEAHFLGDLLRTVDQTEALAPFIEELFHHIKGRKYLDPLSIDEETAVLKEAEHYLIHALIDRQKEREA